MSSHDRGALLLVLSYAARYVRGVGGFREGGAVACAAAGEFADGREGVALFVSSTSVLPQGWSERMAIAAAESSTAMGQRGAPGTLQWMPMAVGSHHGAQPAVRVISCRQA